MWIPAITHCIKIRIYQLVCHFAGFYALSVHLHSAIIERVFVSITDDIRYMKIRYNWGEANAFCSRP